MSTNKPPFSILGQSGQLVHRRVTEIPALLSGSIRE